MKVASARRFETEFERQLGKAAHVVRRVIAGDDFERRTAGVAKFFEHRVQGKLVEPITRRMRNDRYTARGADHVDRLGQSRPAMRHVARLALDQIALEHLAHVAAHALFDQESRKVRAADHPRILRVPQRAFQRAVDAGRRQARIDFLRAPRSPRPHVREPIAQVASSPSTPRPTT